MNFVSPGSGSNGNTGQSQSCARVVPVWLLVSMILLPFAFSLHLCVDELPAVSEYGFPPKSGSDPSHCPDLMWAIIVNYNGL